jgi:hypothetical protein
LHFADNSKAFRIEADSSDYATSRVLSQQSLDDLKWHPIAFYSKSLNAIECNYDIHDKEMLVVMRALEEWWHFLEGAKQKVKIWTDHKNLGVLHDCEETESQTGMMVPLPLEVQLRDAPPPWNQYG